MEKIKRFFIWCLRILIIGAIGFGLVMLGKFLFPNVVYEQKEVIKEIPANLPILEKIAKCESPTGHYGKNGQVAVSGNENHSVDIGWGQINNSIWGQTATDMKYNLWVEQDNKEFSRFLMATRGSEPWSASKSCWNK